MFVGDRNHLRPPRRNLLLLVEKQRDFLVLPLFRAGLVEDLEPPPNFFRSLPLRLRRSTVSVLWVFSWVPQQPLFAELFRIVLHRFRQEYHARQCAQGFDQRQVDSRVLQ